jgi:hypothetical protein
MIKMTMKKMIMGLPNLEAKIMNMILSIRCGMGIGKDTPRFRAQTMEIHKMSSKRS